MATLYVTEYAEEDIGLGARVAPVVMEPPLVDQTVSMSGSHAESSAFNASTQLVRIHTDAICSITFGTAPVATTGMRRLAADQTEYFAVPRGGAFKVSAITNT